MTRRNVSAFLRCSVEGSGIELLKMQLGKPLVKILSFGEMLYYSKQSERVKQSSRIQEEHNAV